MKTRILVSLLFSITLLSFIPQQLLKTKMTITVVDTNNKVVEGAEVNLFKTIDDFNNHNNPIPAAKKSNSKGIVKITKLDAISYYVEVKKGDLSNMFTSEKTPVLDPKKANKITITIE